MSQTRPPIHIYPSWPCYGKDADEQPWSTFETINHTIACTICGAEISRGWQRGRHGEVDMRVCATHVIYAPAEEPRP